MWVNEHGALMVETDLEAVKFTKPVAYQEINGKRVDVSVEYRIQKSALNPKFSKLCVGWIKALVFTPNPPIMFPGKVDSLSLNPPYRKPA